MKSWVVLCGSRPNFREDGLRRALDDAFPGHFLPARDDGGFVVGGPAPEPFLIRSNVPRASGMFMVLAMQGRYLEAEGAAHITDPALRATAVAQRAWFSIDLIRAFGEDGDPYAFIGPALARLAPPDAAVLLHPTLPIALPFGSLIRQQLADGHAADRLGSR